MRGRALTAAVTVAGVAGALLTAVAAPAAAGESTPTNTPAVSVVRLPTGDAVRLRSTRDGAQVSVVAAQPGAVTGQFARLTAGGHEYVLPAEVRPLLGVLDRSLFDVTALAASGSSGSIPVTLSFARGSAVDVPGLTVTARTATSAQGYLAPSTEFRTALVRAWQAAARPGGTAPTSLFGGVTRLAASGAAPQAAAPDYPQVTLVIDVLNAAGNPASAGIVGLINTDNSAKFVNFLFYFRGEARVSVPYGHYSAITDIASFTRSGFTDRIVPLADFDVTANLQHLTLDARRATAMPSVRTPRPASVLNESVEFDRSARVGGSLGFSFGYDGGANVLVAPTDEARVGTLHWLTGWSLVHDSAQPYSYDLSFLDTGAVPADLAKTVEPFQLATVDSRYYNDRQRDSQFVRMPIYPFQFIVFGEFLPLSTPTERTEYVYGGPGAIWTAALIADPSFANPFGGLVDDDFRIYPQGAHFTAAWLRGPLAPKPPEQTSGDSFYVCPGCRSNRTMSVLLAPYADTTPGHFGEVSDPKGGHATYFALYRGTDRLVSRRDYIGARLTVPSGAARYRLHLAVDRSADRTRTSTSTVTDVVFHSAAGAGAPLPSGWYCDAATEDSGCTVLPLLTAQVPLPTDLSDRLPVGDSTFVLTVAPFHGAGSATITSARVQTRVGTGPFRSADLKRLGNGRYQVTLHNGAAAAGQPVTLRVTAADDAGDSITQTTVAAYLVSAATASASAGPSVRAACDSAPAGYARCFARYVVPAADGTASPATAHAVRPRDIREAYNLPAAGGSGRTVAIVDAFDNPRAASDLAKFRARYGLPPCTVANGCFRKVNQAGLNSPLPQRDQGWGLEIALDLDAVSAACPNCHILLVEGDDNGLLSLAKAVRTAVRLGADVVSNSYGADEFGGMREFAKYYIHPGVPITASTGDFGFGLPSFPAVLRTTIAVGGTRLTAAPTTPRGWAERAWSGAGSGCSAYIPKPVWQHDTHCLMRTVGDVSADADPDTGLLVQDSFGFPGTVQVGGTSLSSPLIAAMIAMSADPSTVNNAQGIYADQGELNDVVGGRNGFCGGDYLCTGLPGYDAPTGMGTPNGVGALS